MFQEFHRQLRLKGSAALNKSLKYPQKSLAVSEQKISAGKTGRMESQEKRLQLYARKEKNDPAMVLQDALFQELLDKAFFEGKTVSQFELVYGLMPMTARWTKQAICSDHHWSTSRA